MKQCNEEEDEDEGYNEDLDLESILRELEDEDEGEDVKEEYDEGEVGDGMDSDEVETEDEENFENDVSSGIKITKWKMEKGDSSKVGQTDLKVKVPMNQVVKRMITLKSLMTYKKILI